MKAIKLINLFILTLFCQVLFSQNNDIIKSFDLRMDKSVEKGLNSKEFPMNNAQWKECVIFDYELPDGLTQPPPIEINYMIQGDTIVDNVKRGKLYFSLLSEVKPELIGFIHTNNSKVYFRAKEDVNLADKYILLCNENENGDILLYDFTLNINDVYQECFGNYLLSDVDNIILGNIDRKKYIFSSSIYPGLKKYWIEGIGSIQHLFEPVTQSVADLYYKKLICFSQNKEVLWLNPDFGDCSVSTYVLLPEKETFIKVYPNPMDEKSLLVSSSYFMQRIQIFDTKGVLVSDINANNCLQYQLDRRLPLSSGIYFVNVVFQNKLSEQIKLILK